MDALARFANFPDDSSWLAAVRECQGAPIAQTHNPLQDLHQPLTAPHPAVSVRTVASAVTPLEYIEGGGAGGGKRPSAADMRKVAVKMSNFRQKRGEESSTHVVSDHSQSQSQSQPITEALHQPEAASHFPLPNAKRRRVKQHQHDPSSFDRDSGRDSDGDSDGDEPHGNDAYQSDDDRLRDLLEEEDLSASDDDDDRLCKQQHGQGQQQQGQQQRGQLPGQTTETSYAMTQPTGREAEAATRFRNILPSSRDPGHFHVFVPLPSYRYVRTSKRNSTNDGDVFYYAKKRNMERLTGKFPSMSDAILAYDACIRRLYGYEGFSFSTKPDTNEWHFSADSVSSKRPLREFSHQQQQHQQQQAAQEEQHTQQSCSHDPVSDEELPYASSLSDPSPRRSKRPKRGQKARRVQLKVAPTPDELDGAYRTYIENSLRQMGKVQDLTSFSAWRRRSSLINALQDGPGCYSQLSCAEEEEEEEGEEEEEREEGGLDAQCSDTAAI
jgi:hypothetical protein